MNLINWLRPEPLRLKQLTATEVSGIPGSWTLDETPCVTFAGHRTERLYKDFMPLMKAAGYRPVERDILTLSTIYARPLPIWAFYLGLFRLRLCFWWFIRVIYDVGLIHPSDSLSDGVQARLVDWRLGPSLDARYFYRTLIGKIVQKARRFVCRIKE